MRTVIGILLLLTFPVFAKGQKEYRLVWSDEFEVDGRPSKDWTFERGFKRNQELQWYQSQNGEIDMMEYYIKDGVPSILANACWGSTERWKAVWDSVVMPFSHFTEKDPDWADKFHIWRMDWNKDFIRLYLDDELLNEIDLSKTVNGGYGGNHENPFSNTIPGFKHYILLNLALGSNGGEPDSSQFPLRYLIDYVRVYQK